MEEGKYGRRIRAFRKLKRVQQAELASRIGISTTSLGRIERGEREPSKELLNSIAEQLHINVEELMDESLRGGK